MKNIFKSKYLIIFTIMLVMFTLTSTNKILAATFTVDSTGDEPDVGNDGLCLTAGGTCTLRAAITAAGHLAGADNIYFNIPTSDSGYRDYDDPNTPNSGDSIGGDDYWTIRPTTLLGYVFGVIDGETQETTTGFDRNIYGPDIEVDASGIPNPGPQDQAIVGLLGTNGTINKLTLNSYGYGAGIFSNANGVTITKNYIGTDVKGLVSKPSVTGIGLNQANNVTIGNDQSDGNIINATLYGIINQCTNANPNKIAGNKIGIAADGISAFPMTTAIFMHTNCNSVIGGDTPAERNYIASTTSYAIRFEGNLNATGAIHEVYNNYIGTDINGNISHALEVKDAAIADVYGGDLVGYKTITIGDIGKGNLIANSRYGVRLNAPKSVVTISSNTIIKTIWGIMGYRYSNPDPDNDTNWYDDINIYNNYIGDYADPDPYFGHTYMAGDWTCTDCYDQNYINRTGISIGGFNGNIKGNYIVGNLYNGIVTDNYSSLSTQSVIGGQSVFAGSLCEGLEKNCLDNNGIYPLDNAYGGGIFLFMSPPLNFSTIYQDNSFGNGNGLNSNENITLFTSGEFELLSGTTRRTDLSNFELTVPAPSGIEAYDAWGGIYNDGKAGPTTEYTNYNVYCTDPGYCPTSGTSSGTDEMTSTLISKLGYQDYEPGWFQYYITDAYQYIPMVKFDNSDNQIIKTLAKFEENHFSSLEFSFDADSTTNPQDYPGLGEPWTDDITATQAVSLTKNYYSTESGLKQVMEVQYVDANPIRQDDGSYIIYVDSTTDEDNVSTCGFDDGYGAYSGGGCGGVDGLPDGKTSLREAMFVANQGITPLTIEFNIPITDSGYRDYNSINTISSGDSADGDDLFVIELSSDLPEITDFRNVTIDGASQEANSGANRNTFGPDIFISGAGNATNIFTTQTSEATKNLLTLTINGLIINNSTDKLIYLRSNYLSVPGSESVIISNNYLCTDAKGLELSATCATEVINSDEINGNITINNNLIGWANSNTVYNTIYINAPLASTDVLIKDNKIGTNTSGSALTKAVDGKAIFVESTQDNSNVNIQTNIINTTEGTCIFTRGKVSITENYCGTDNSGNNILTVSEIYSEGAVTLTNNVVARIIVTNRSTEVPVAVLNNTIGTNKNHTQNFDLSSFVGAGNTTPTAEVLSAFETNSGVAEFRDNFISSTYSGVYVSGVVPTLGLYMHNNTLKNIDKDGLIIESINFNALTNASITIKDNTFDTISQKGILLKSITKSVSGGGNLEISSNIFNNIIGVALDVEHYAKTNTSFASPIIKNNTFNNVITTAISVKETFGIKLNQNIFTNITSTNPLIDLLINNTVGFNSNDTNDADSYSIDFVANDGMNSPEIETVSYLGENKYRISGTLKNNVTSEDPYDLEICLAETNSKGCTQSIFYEQNYILSNGTGTNNWSADVTLTTHEGINNFIFISLATNHQGSTSEFSTPKNVNINVTAPTSSESQSTTSYPVTVEVTDIASYPESDPSIIYQNNVGQSADLSNDDQNANTIEVIPPAAVLLVVFVLGLANVYTASLPLSQLILLIGYKQKKQDDDPESLLIRSVRLLFKTLTVLGFAYSVIVLILTPSLLNLVIVFIYILIFVYNLRIYLKDKSIENY